ncbi:MAG TPA: hypothetical protein VNO30_20505 [Kofleriaceae bacterium]|nr:hypothetical protein [Kofleriaceae bacterium]
MTDDLETDDRFGSSPAEAELMYARNPTGATLDGGRVIIDALVSGKPYTERWCIGPGGAGLWRARQLVPRERPVLVSYGSADPFLSREIYDTWVRYETFGIAPLLYFGYLDGVTPLDEAAFLRLRKRGVYPHMALAEARPDGEQLSLIDPLSPAEAVRLGLGLCDTLLALDGRGILGLRPETVYVAGEPGHRYYAGAAPRAFLMLGYGLGEAHFDPPTLSAFDRGVDEIVYTVALLIWFGLLREHAFICGTQRNDFDNMCNDVRAPFTGPPELGRLLEAVLVADVEQRMKAPELREELSKLAARWGVEPPPFPPPGLA